MIGLDDLYQEILLEHYKQPHNLKNLKREADLSIHENPSCGDSTRILVGCREGKFVENIYHDTKGCAISVASASLMTIFLANQSFEKVLENISLFLKIMRREEKPDILESWGDLICLAGVIQYPLRVKCATLAWHALQEALLQGE